MNFEIGSKSDSLTFIDRLARENGWSRIFAERCVIEYKRFIYLAMISDAPVTPSDQVDQVWHLHLTYTVSYWLEFCGNILGKPLHHGPTKGGVIEANKYHSQYQKTLDRYLMAFNEAPSSDIWPSCHQRFHNAGKFVRLNSNDYVLINRNRLWSLGVITALPFFLAACVKDNVDVFSLGAFAFLFLVVVYIVYRLFYPRSGNKKNGGCGAACGGNNDGGSGCGSGCGGCGG